jgi:glycosyltransferase involved in cell wall biosynthesis
MTAVGRNDPCPCGSGKRYKHCCGRARNDDGAVAGPAPAGEAQRLMSAALAAQVSRRLDEAERLYREALARAPDAADALHMLGVIRYERKDYAEARALILRALDLTAWRYRAYRHNLGLVVARANQRGDRLTQDARQREYRAWQVARSAQPSSVAPRVAIVIPAYNHEHYVEAALESVFAQTYRDIEIVVIDDGSSDATADAARRALERSPFPHQMIMRENRGAAATINEGIARTRAPFVNVLNSDDVFAPERIATMVRAIAGAGRVWGFSAVDFVDAAGAAIDTLRDSRAYALSCAIAAIPFARSTGFALLAGNVAVSTGNLFVARSLWESLGGFCDLRYNHDWDFALRALWREEPVFVRDHLYRYRLHRGNTITESATKPREEADVFMSDYLALASGNDVPHNPFAPSVRAWGADFAVAVLEGGLAGTLEVPMLRQLVQLATDVEAQ